MSQFALIGGNNSVAKKNKGTVSKHMVPPPPISSALKEEDWAESGQPSVDVSAIDHRHLARFFRNAGCIMPTVTKHQNHVNLEYQTCKHTKLPVMPFNQLQPAPIEKNTPISHPPRTLRSLSADKTRAGLPCKKSKSQVKGPKRRGNQVGPSNPSASMVSKRRTPLAPDASKNYHCLMLHVYELEVS